MANPTKLDRWLPELYDQLRRMAGGFLARERQDHTLQPTALVHEACVRLFQQRAELKSPTHLQAIAATAMRRILVDHARKHRSPKHGGDWQRITLAGARAHDRGLALDDFLALDAALERLQAHDPDAARVVELRFFGGLGMAEIAEALGRSKRNVERDWTHSRAWLAAELAAGRDQ